MKFHILHKHLKRPSSTKEIFNVGGNCSGWRCVASYIKVARYKKVYEPYLVLLYTTVGIYFCLKVPVE